MDKVWPQYDKMSITKQTSDISDYRSELLFFIKDLVISDCLVKGVLYMYKVVQSTLEKHSHVLSTIIMRNENPG